MNDSESCAAALRRHRSKRPPCPIPQLKLAVMQAAVEDEERIRRIAAPKHVARHPGFRTPCARTGVCMECNAEDRICDTRKEMLRRHPAGGCRWG